MSNEQIYFAIKHPTRGIVGDTVYPFLNEDEPDKVKIYAPSFFKHEDGAKKHRDNVWKDCEVVPVTITWP